MCNQLIKVEKAEVTGDFLDRTTISPPRTVVDMWIVWPLPISSIMIHYGLWEQFSLFGRSIVLAD